MQSNQVRIDGRQFSVSRLDKILWPKECISKGNLITYYLDIAPYILVHLKDRPVVFTRYPNGINGKYFYQKNAPAYLPEWINTFRYYSSDSEKYINFVMIEERAALAWLANQACIEIHPWLSRIDIVEYPDFAVIDLDPTDNNSYLNVVAIAQIIKNILHELKLRSYIKTSGSDGLHIYIPVINKYTYCQIRDFCYAVASVTAKLRPDIATTERTVHKRGPRVYLDYLQNVKGKTLCSPYSVRPREKATISTPLKWEEVSYARPQDFSISSILPRLKKEGDLFAPVLKDKQSLDKAATKLGLDWQMINN